MAERYPMQPVVMVNGVARFKENPIARYLLDMHPGEDMNSLAVRFHNEPEARSQLAQLIGYSVFGAADLDYVSDETIAAADAEVSLLIRKGGE